MWALEQTFAAITSVERRRVGGKDAVFPINNADAGARRWRGGPEQRIFMYVSLAGRMDDDEQQGRSCSNGALRLRYTTGVCIGHNKHVRIGGGGEGSRLRQPGYCATGRFLSDDAVTMGSVQRCVPPDAHARFEPVAQKKLFKLPPRFTLRSPPPVPPPAPTSCHTARRTRVEPMNSHGLDSSTAYRRI